MFFSVFFLMYRFSFFFGFLELVLVMSARLIV